MSRKKRHFNPGHLLIIGGGEDKKGDAKILKEVVQHAHGGKICVATVASRQGRQQWEEYRRVFYRLGAKHLAHLDVAHRFETADKRALAAVKGSSAVFFTGGDQLRITSELGGTPIAEAIYDVYENGGLIAGTSAGASVMSETMLVSGTHGSHRRDDGVKMAPGLGFLKGIIVDQHFSERGRVGRLLGAVAMNPKFLGLGIDENTAVLVDRKNCLCVKGSGAVYVIDAHEATGTNVSEDNSDRCLSIFNVRCHVLSDTDHFDLNDRRVYHLEKRKAA